MESTAPTGPMTIGNIVSTGFQLYLNNFVRYILISLRAALWLLLPVGLALVGAFGAVLLGEQLGENLALLALVIPAWFVLFIFCLAQSMGEAAAITRLAYQELIQSPEEPRQALRFTRSRKWSFVGAEVLRSLVFFATYCAFGLIFGLLVIAAVFATGAGAALLSPTGPEDMNPAFLILIGLLVLVGLLIFLVFYCWLLTRFLLIAPPLAVEQTMGAADALGRSWKLTQGQVMRSLLVATVAFLVSIPVTVLVLMISNLVNNAIWVLGSELDPTIQVLSFLLSYLVNIISGIAINPFWQTIFATLYLDLRNRKEGLDLRLFRS